MSETAPIEPGATPLAGTTGPGWRVRVAGRGDVAAVALAVREMLFELGGAPPATAELKEAAQAVVDDDDAGTLLVAESDDRELVGVLGVSWQTAVRVPGRYGLIQELWVRPAWRGKAIGADLLLALFELAHQRGVARIEVGLPSERFPNLAATEAFYLGSGFTAIGTRMRRILR